ncbi:MAG: hypothetical protein PHD95_02860 [Candidatus ainarchaeum sp.]|nr:hypothetical protein [Candidatus ainarchaeum sp.]
MPGRMDRLLAQKPDKEFEFEPTLAKSQGEGFSWRVLKNKKIVFGIALAAIAIAAVLTALFFAFPAQEGNFEIIVKNSDGSALSGIEVKYSVDGLEATAKTNSGGKIFLHAKKDSEISVLIEQQSINGTDYSVYSSDFVVADSFSKEILLEKLGETIDERTIVFQKTDGSRITGKLITIKLSCANGFRLAQETATDSDKDGQIKIVKPEECNILSARLIAPLDYRQANFTIGSSSSIVQLESNSEASPKGEIRVKIVDSENNLVTATDFTVQLIAAEGFVRDEKKTDGRGEIVFTDVELGTYFISAFDYAGEYEIMQDSAVVISSGLEQEKTLFAAKSTKGTIDVSVIDKATKIGIPNATVQLFAASGDLLAEETTGSEGFTVKFSVKEEGTYKVSAMQENYLPNETTVETRGEATIELEELTSGNSGIIEVSVVDEDELPVENAKVVLKNPAGETMPYPAKYTDAKGIAKFSGVSEGAYYAYAEKFPTFGDNSADAMEIDIRGKNNFIVRLDIGTATIKISAFESSEIMLEESEAEIYAENGELLQRIAMPDGTAEFSTKADKKVFAIAKMPGYNSVQTIPMQLWPNETIEFNLQMRQKNSGALPEMKFEGIFNGSQKTGMLKAGKEYLALFSIEIQENNEISRGGIHFRVGEEQSLETEKIAITGALFAMPDSVYGGKSFTPNLGYDADLSDSITEAKWVNIEFVPGSEGKKYFVGFEFKVKKETQPNGLLALHYRAWFESNSGKFLRIPEDSELGDSESTASKQGLYAKTLDLEFGEGIDTDCGESVCYGNEWIFGNHEKELQRENYSLGLDRDYNLNFEIKNNSDAAIEKPEISIIGSNAEDVEFKNLIAYNKAKKTLESKKGNIENFSLDGIGQGETVNFNLLFTPKKPSLGYIETTISSNGKEIFSGTIWVDTQAGKTMALEIKPEEIPAFFEADINALVSTEDEGPVQDAEIWMTRTLADNSIAKEKANTSSRGEAKFKLAGAMPGTKIVFKALKDGYYDEPVEKIISEKVFEISEEALEAQIDTKEDTQETLSTAISNLTAAELEIFSVSISGSTKSLLDKEAMDNFFSSLKGTKIQALESKTIEMVKVQLSQGTEIEKDETLALQLLVTVIEPKTGKKFDAKIPLAVKIRPFPTAAMSCIKVDKQEWLGSTIGNHAVLELEMENTCSEEGKSEVLARLLAKTVWAENSIGIVEILEADSPDGAAEILGENNWRTVMQEIGAGRKIKVTLVFTPKPETLGKTAEFKIILDGQKETERGLKFVGSTEINAKIDIANIGQCIKTDKSLLEIKKGASSADFSIDTTGCQAAVEIGFCRNDDGCKGGAAEGTIQLSAKSIMLSPSNPKAKIIVSKGSIAGMYGVNIEAKTQNSDWEQIKTIDVLIEPNDNALFTLDKYEFSIIGNSAKDSATAFNPNLSENVEVIAPVDSWYQSVQNTESFFDPELAGTGKTHLELANAKIAADLAKQKMEEMAQKASGEADKGQQLSDAAKKALEQAKQDSDQADQKAQDVTSQAGQLASLAGLLLGQGQAVEAAVAANPFCKAELVAAKAMNKALLTAKTATMGANTGAQAASSATSQGKNNCEQGQQMGNQGLDNAVLAQKGPCETQTISSRAGEGAQQSAQAAQQMMQAAQQDQQCGQQMQNAGTQFAKVGTNLAGTGAQIGIVETQSQIIAACVTAGPALTAFKTKFYAFKATENGLTSANAAAQSQAETAKQSADQANNAAQAANNQNNIANDQLQKLSVVETNAEEAAGFGKGRTIGILGSYVGLATLVGSYKGNAYNAYLGNCPNGFKSTLPDFVTNLKEDSSDIVLDNQNIVGNWNTEEAKIFGEYESQTAGISFENQNLESEKPVYALARLLAYRHKHVEPTTIITGTYAGAGTADASAAVAGTSFGPFNVPDEEEKMLVEQKFHLKFIAGEKKASPAANSDDACLNGAMFGITGEKALPKIKLNWNWNESEGISEDNCIAENSKAIYCDAAQFSIMASKRLKTLQEFVEKNSSISCPTNNAIESLKWIVDKWNPYINEIGGQQIPTDLQELNPECWMPKSTFIYDGKPAINYYVEEADSKKSVSWTSKIKSPEGLEKYIRSNVLLIKDGYSENFQKDFANYYSTAKLMDAPEWFVKNSSGKWLDYFLNNEKLKFSQKFLDSTEMPNAGMFESFFNIDFGKNWGFFSEAKTPKATVKIELNFKKEPEEGSMFYYLPFDAEIGSQGGAGREGYGLSYQNSEKEFLVANANNVPISTVSGNGSGIAALYTNTTEDIRITNSSFAKRGLLLGIKETGSQNEKQLDFYPTNATPAIAEISSEQSTVPFSAYYKVTEAGVPAKATENFSFWTAAGECKNFDEKPLLEKFNSLPDRYAEELDSAEQASDSYAFDFEKADRSGKLYLKTIFYTPASKAYAVTGILNPDPMQKAAITFKSANTGFQAGIDLDGTGQKFNNRKAQENAAGLDNLLELVKEKRVCITNSQEETNLWWNELPLLETDTGNGSIAGFNGEC